MTDFQLERLPVVYAPEAKRLAEKHCPIIRQCIRGPEDFICRIGADKTDQINFEPPLYFSARKAKKGSLYLLYMVYHYYDSAAMHDHDTESFLVCPDTGEMAAVHHLRFEFATQLSSVEIESGGHSLHLKPHTRFYGPAENHIVYHSLKFENMGEHEFIEHTEAYRSAFAPALLPDEQKDIELEKWVKKYKPEIEGARLTTTKGLLLYRPDVLFHLAEEAGMM